MKRIEISEVGNLQIFGGKMDFWWIILGKMVHCWEKKILT